jgi:hypothetical protein
VIAGLAMIMAQICCAPPVQATPSQCPLKYHGGCPMRKDTCGVTAPQRSTAVTPKPIVAAVSLHLWSAAIAETGFTHVPVFGIAALQRSPMDLVLRI